MMCWAKIFQKWLLYGIVVGFTTLSGANTVDCGNLSVNTSVPGLELYAKAGAVCATVEAGLSQIFLQWRGLVTIYVDGVESACSVLLKQETSDVVSIDSSKSHVLKWVNVDDSSYGSVTITKCMVHVKMNGNGGVVSEDEEDSVVVTKNRSWTREFQVGCPYGDFLTDNAGVYHYDLQNHGQSLVGWFTHSRYGKRVASSDVTRFGVTQLYAHWLDYANPELITVSFDPNGGTVTPSQLIYTNAIEYGYLPIPVKEGFRFDGWVSYDGLSGQIGPYYVDGEYMGPFYVDETTSASKTGTNLVARWSEAQHCHVIYNYNYGGNYAVTNVVNVGGALHVFHMPPQRDGYLFDGWYTDSSEGIMIGEGYIVTADLRLYAHWAKSVTVTFDANGGSCEETFRKLSVGSELTTLPTPTRSGYDFAGWYTESADGEQIIEGLVVTEDLHVYAHWSEQRYDLTYLMSDDGYIITGISPRSVENITIPVNIGGIQVIGIGESAFRFCHTLKTVVVPYGVRNIGANAFVGCENLLEITLPGSVTNIGRRAFFECEGLRAASLGDGLTEIEGEAFCCCGLTSIDIPNSVTSVGVGSFSSCTNLASAHLPDGLTRIEGSLFNNCPQLKTLNIPSAITNVGMWAFRRCKTLSAIIMPECLVGIEDGAFEGSGLESIQLPDTVMHIGCGAFYGCTKLSDVMIPAGITRVESDTFYSCSALRSILIPSTIASIGAYAFAGCSSLRSVEMSNSVTNIGTFAFGNCTSLVSISIPACVGEMMDYFYPEYKTITHVTICDGVSAIKSYGFRGCSALKSITIPPSVKSIGREAFSGCTGLGDGVVVQDDCVLCVNGDSPETVVLPIGTRLIAGGAFYGKKTLRKLIVPNTVVCIGNSAFSGCKALEELVIPDGVGVIEPGAFYGCSGLTNITLSSSIETVGNSAFYGCTGLLSVDLSNNLSKIEDYLFYGCNNLESISIPSCVGEIGQNAFCQCSKLRIVEIPSSVKFIGASAFCNCSSLKELICHEGLQQIGYGAFSRCAELNKLMLPSTLRVIGQEAFYGCKKLSRLDLPTGLLSIGSSAFSDCSSVESLVIPNGVEMIHEHTFAHCSSLKSLVIPHSVSFIGARAFYGCPGLGQGLVIVDGCVLGYNGECPKTVTLPVGVRMVAGGAFYYCTELISVNIPEGVEVIGDEAFSYCRGLTDIVLPQSVMSIGYSAFSECSELVMVNIPNGVVNIGDGAFGGCQKLAAMCLPSGIKNVPVSLFACCENLESVTMCAGVTNIGECAFRNCKSLSMIEMPASIVRIGNWAFEGGSSLTNITFDGAAPLTDYYSFDGVGKSCVVTVCEGSTGWDADGDGMWCGMKLIYKAGMSLPDLGKEPSSDSVSGIVSTFVDEKMRVNLKTSEYVDFREWASRLTTKDGKGTPVQALKECRCLWLSYALGQGTLLDAAPKDEDLKVDAFTPATEAGKFDFTVSVKDVEVGSTAVAENLKKVFELEGGVSLDSLSSDNVDITFGTPEDGKVKFTAGPKDATQSTFFMKVKMAQ